MSLSWASSPSTLAAAIAIHTLEEAMILPFYQKAIGMSHINTRLETILDSLPVFLILPLSSEYLTKMLGDNNIRLVLATICLWHPLFDHVYFTHKLRRLRPGSITAILMLLPLGIWNFFQYQLPKDSRSQAFDMAAVGLGGLISYFLYSEVATELKPFLCKNH
jgi:Protein of unknown function with HXXEE motif